MRDSARPSTENNRKEETNSYFKDISFNQPRKSSSSTKTRQEPTAMPDNARPLPHSSVCCLITQNLKKESHSLNNDAALMYRQQQGYANVEVIPGSVSFIEERKLPDEVIHMMEERFEHEDFEITAINERYGLAMYCKGRTMIIYSLLQETIDAKNYVKMPLQLRAEDYVTSSCFLRPSMMIKIKADVLLAVATLTSLQIYGFSFIDQKLVNVERVDFQDGMYQQVASIVQSDKSGRVFYGLQDGSVHELVLDTDMHFIKRLWYQSNNGRKLKSVKSTMENSFISMTNYLPSIFTRTIYSTKQIKIDDTRNILYALLQGNDTQKSTKIVVYDLGSKGLSFHQIVTIPCADLLKHMVGKNRHISPYEVDLEAFSFQNYNIMTIEPITIKQSRSINLQIFLTQDIRLFILLGTVQKEDNEREVIDKRFQVRGDYSLGDRPNGHWEIVEQSYFLDPESIHIACIDNKVLEAQLISANVCRPLDLFLFDSSAIYNSAHSKNQFVITFKNEKAYLDNREMEGRERYGRRCALPESACSFALPLSEHETILDIKQLLPLQKESTLAMLGLLKQGSEQAYLGSISYLYESLSVYETQTYLPSSRYSILTNKRVFIVYQQRPIDLLVALISRFPANVVQSKLFEDFAMTFGISEAMNMLLQIIVDKNESYVVSKDLNNRIVKDVQREMDEQRSMYQLRKTSKSHIESFRMSHSSRKSPLDQSKNIDNVHSSGHGGTFYSDAKDCLNRYPVLTKDIIVTVASKEIRSVAKQFFKVYGCLIPKVSPFNIKFEVETLSGNYMLNSLVTYTGRILRPLIDVTICFIPVINRPSKMICNYNKFMMPALTKIEHLRDFVESKEGFFISQITSKSSPTNLFSSLVHLDLNSKNTTFLSEMNQYQWEIYLGLKQFLSKVISTFFIIKLLTDNTHMISVLNELRQDSAKTEFAHQTFNNFLFDRDNKFLKIIVDKIPQAHHLWTQAESDGGCHSSVQHQVNNLLSRSLITAPEHRFHIVKKALDQILDNVSEINFQDVISPLIKLGNFTALFNIGLLQIESFNRQINSSQERLHSRVQPVQDPNQLQVDAQALIKTVKDIDTLLFSMYIGIDQARNNQPMNKDIDTKIYELTYNIVKGLDSAKIHAILRDLRLQVKEHSNAPLELKLFKYDIATTQNNETQPENTIQNQPLISLNMNSKTITYLLQHLLKSGGGITLLEFQSIMKTVEDQPQDHLLLSEVVMEIIKGKIMLENESLDLSTKKDFLEQMIGVLQDDSFRETELPQVRNFIALYNDYLTCIEMQIQVRDAMIVRTEQDSLSEIERLAIDQNVEEITRMYKATDKELFQMFIKPNELFDLYLSYIFRCGKSLGESIQEFRSFVDTQIEKNYENQGRKSIQRLIDMLTEGEMKVDFRGIYFKEIFDSLIMIVFTRALNNEEISLAEIDQLLNVSLLETSFWLIEYCVSKMSYENILAHFKTYFFPYKPNDNVMKITWQLALIQSCLIHNKAYSDVNIHLQTRMDQIEEILKRNKNEFSKEKHEKLIHVVQTLLVRLNKCVGVESMEEKKFSQKNFVNIVGQQVLSQKPRTIDHRREEFSSGGKSKSRILFANRDRM